MSCYEASAPRRCTRLFCGSKSFSKKQAAAFQGTKQLPRSLSWESDVPGGFKGSVPEGSAVPVSILIHLVVAPFGKVHQGH